MRPLSLGVPKALLPFCGRPLLQYTIEHLAEAGIENAALVFGSMDKSVRERIESLEGRGIMLYPISCSLEYGSAGIIPVVAERLEKEHGISCAEVLVIYGDSLLALDFGAMLAAHRAASRRGCLLTIAFHRPDDLIVPGRTRTNYGILSLSEDNRVWSFREKPEIAGLASNSASAGVFLLSKDVFQRFPLYRPADLAKDVLMNLVCKVESPAFGFDIEPGYRYDIGTVPDYIDKQFLVLDGGLALKGFSADSSCLSEGSSLASGHFLAVSGKALVGRECQIGAGCSLRGKNVIGDRVKIGEGTAIENSIILDGSTIGKNARITGAVIGCHCDLADQTAIGVGSVIGNFSRISRG
jgi:NDP-sugar pyrophosphorylase family protein